jgi:hypothetical protein
MKKILFLLLGALLCGCATDPLTSNTLKALKKDYLNGKMSEEKYLRRVEAFKHLPKQTIASADQKQQRQHRYYMEYQSLYLHQQEPLGPGIYCSENLDGGITCEKHVYTK